MSANNKRSKEMPQEKTIEAKMKKILAEITAIDAKTIRLAKNRENLLQKYEELKDAKLIRDAKSCSVEQDWENGMNVERIYRVIFFFVHFILRFL